MCETTSVSKASYALAIFTAFEYTTYGIFHFTLLDNRIILGSAFKSLQKSSTAVPTEEVAFVRNILSVATGIRRVTIYKKEAPVSVENSERVLDAKHTSKQKLLKHFTLSSAKKSYYRVEAVNEFLTCELYRSKQETYIQ